jgi:hypothetical protein
MIARLAAAALLACAAGLSPPIEAAESATTEHAAFPTYVALRRAGRWVFAAERSSLTRLDRTTGDYRRIFTSVGPLVFGVREDGLEALCYYEVNDELFRIRDPGPSQRVDKLKLPEDMMFAKPYASIEYSSDGRSAILYGENRTARQVTAVVIPLDGKRPYVALFEAGYMVARWKEHVIYESYRYGDQWSPELGRGKYVAYLDAVSGKEIALYEFGEQAKADGTWWTFAAVPLASRAGVRMGAIVFDESKGLNRAFVVDLGSSALASSFDAGRNIGRERAWRAYAFFDPRDATLYWRYMRQDKSFIGGGVTGASGKRWRPWPLMPALIQDAYLPREGGWLGDRRIWAIDPVGKRLLIVDIASRRYSAGSLSPFLVSPRTEVVGRGYVFADPDELFFAVYEDEDFPYWTRCPLSSFPEPTLPMASGESFDALAARILSGN